MNEPTGIRNDRKSGRKRNPATKSRRLLAAVGSACGLISTAAPALELGQIEVQSSLGQPLRASIAYALNPTEQIDDYCIFLRPGRSDGGLRSLSRARVSVGNGVITLTGNTPIREPMLAMRLTVNCPYTAHLARNYTLMFDPGEAVAADAATERRAQPGQARPQAVPEIVPATAAAARPQPSAPPAAISAGSRYRVQPGDSLSAIVARIPNRTVALWPAVDAIFSANPEAFIDGDRNLLKAGSWLTIPAMDGIAMQAPQPPVEAAAGASSDVSGSAYPGYTESATEQLGETVEMLPDSNPAPVAEVAAADSLEPAAVSGTVPDFGAAIEAPATRVAASDTVPSADTASPHSTETPVPPVRDVAGSDPRTPAASFEMSAPAAATGTSSWKLLAWLGGSGIALFIGLLLFGRNLRSLFGSTPAGEAAPTRRATDQTAAVAADDEVDFTFSDASSSHESFTLDADLEQGSGLQDGSGIEIVQDFGIPVDGDSDAAIDLELPAVADTVHLQQTTEIVRPESGETTMVQAAADSVSDEFVDAELSISENTIKQDITESDDAGAEAENSQYTLTQEIDYKTLERDYEEEFTATQALSEELARAAFDLAREAERNEATAETREMPQAGDEDPAAMADLTSALPSAAVAENEDFLSELDDTGVNEELTIEMPPEFDDATAEMDIANDGVGTRRSKAS